MVFKKLAALLAEHTSTALEEIKMETSFEELGIDSLDTVEMVMELEEELEIELNLNEKVETVGALVKFIEKSMENK